MKLNIALIIGGILMIGLNNNAIAQLKILPLGNSITYDNNSGDSRPLSERIAYRKRLYDLLTTAGYDFEFVGSENSGEPTIADGDNGGFPGIKIDQLASLLVTGIINQSPSTPLNYSNGATVTSGPYLDEFMPDVILLHIGTNEVVSSTAAQVENILDEVDAYEGRTGKNIPVFVARIIRESPNNTATQTFNNAVASMVSTRISGGDNLIMVNMETGAGINYALEPTGEMVDTYHPNQSGYNKMADLWFSSMNSYFSASGITSSPVTEAVVGNAYSYQVMASGNPASSFSFVGATPTGMAIDPQTGIISWLPVQSQIGSHSITVSAANGVGTDTQNFDITVTIDNDPPTFTKGMNIEVDEDEGPQSFSAWATNINDGDPELDQNLTFIINDNSNPSLFSSGPQVSSSGTLTFETALNEFGSATITLSLEDDGDGTPPNQNTSTQKNFTITVNAVNDLPVITGISDLTIPKDAVYGPVPFTISDVDNDVSSLTISATSNNQFLIDDADITIEGSGGSRSYSLQPNQGLTGESIITIAVSDGMGSSEVEFTLTVSNITSNLDEIDDKLVEVYPSPHTNKFSISIGNIPAKEVSISLFNLSGQRLWSLENTDKFQNNDPIIVNTHGFKQGVYILKIQGEDLNITKRILKKD